MMAASMSSFGGDGEDNHGLSSAMFPRLEAQLLEADKGYTATLLKTCPERALMEYEMLARAKILTEVRKIHGFHVVCPLVCLPNEVLVKHILSILDPVSLCRVSLTCCFFYELASDNILWRRHYELWERKWEVASRKARLFGPLLRDAQRLLSYDDSDEDDDDEDGQQQNEPGLDLEDDDDYSNAEDEDDEHEEEEACALSSSNSETDELASIIEGEAMVMGNDDSDEQPQLSSSSESDGDGMDIVRQDARAVRIGRSRDAQLRRAGHHPVGNEKDGKRTKAKTKRKAKAKTKTKANKKREKETQKALYTQSASLRRASVGLISSTPGFFSGRPNSLSLYGSSGSDVPTKPRRGSAIIGLSSGVGIGGGGAANNGLRRTNGDLGDALTKGPAGKHMARQESDGERREREKMVRDLEREWRRTLDRVARREARDERAYAFYWKHCFRELEIRALNRKKKDLSPRKQAVLQKLLSRAGTNLFLRSAVFPLPLRWIQAKEAAAAASASAKQPCAAGRKGSWRGSKGDQPSADSPFRPVVTKVFERSKRLLSLRHQQDWGDDAYEDRPGNLPPNEEWVHFGSLREVRGGDDLLTILFSVKGTEDIDPQKQRAVTLQFMKEVRGVLGGEIEGIWEDAEYGCGGGDSHRLVVFSTPGRRGLLLQWSWENNSNLLQPWHTAGAGQ